MNTSSRRLKVLALAAALLPACGGSGEAVKKPRLSLFVGFDISQSFLEGPHYEDAVHFLAHYLYAHMNGWGGLDVPATLFVGPIGGTRADEAKTFYPKETFEGKSVKEIQKILFDMFPKGSKNPTTDFNAFFKDVAETVKSRNLLLRPIGVVMVSDGKPYVKEKGGKVNFRDINVKPLEKLARNITLRLLYTDAVTGRSWQTEVPRRNVRVWTQDAKVMAYWKDPSVLLPDTPLENQDKLYAWIKSNVDFGVRARRVS
ncbi:MAG: hypothetical protein NHG36_07510 [Chromatiaceae bacterium]|nr:hypothetical protein [Candidatus Thioaporhodococcus sediminis]